IPNIVNTLDAGGRPKVFEDRTVSPTYLADAARATRLLLESSAPTGLYHCVNSGYCTWLELAQALARGMGGDALVARLVPVRMADVTLRAIRPRFCALSNAKLRAIGIEMPPWQDAVSRFLAPPGRPSHARRASKPRRWAASARRVGCRTLRRTARSHAAAHAPRRSRVCAAGDVDCRHRARRGRTPPAAVLRDAPAPGARL